MKESREFLKDSRIVVNEIKQLIKAYSDGEMLEVDFGNTPDDIQIEESYGLFLNHLAESVRSIDYLTRKTKDLGYLHYDKELHRFCNDDHKLHSGETFEVLLPEDCYHDYPRWFSTRIEYGTINHSYGWYLVGAEKFPLEGLKVRVRE